MSGNTPKNNKNSWKWKKKITKEDRKDRSIITQAFAHIYLKVYNEKKNEIL